MDEKNREHVNLIKANLDKHQRIAIDVEKDFTSEFNEMKRIFKIEIDQY